MTSLTDTRSGIEENDFETGHANEMTYQPLYDLIYQKRTIRGCHDPRSTMELFRYFLKIHNCEMIGQWSTKQLRQFNPTVLCQNCSCVNFVPFLVVGMLT